MNDIEPARVDFVPIHLPNSQLATRQTKSRLFIIYLFGIPGELA